MDPSSRGVAREGKESDDAGDGEKGLVAIKHLYIRAPSIRERVHDATREVKILQPLSHPNIIAVKDVVWEKDRGCVHLVMPALPADLGEAIDAKCSGYSNSGGSEATPRLLSEAAVKELARQLLQAFVYLHDERGICHRDAKPANLLLALEKEKEEEEEEEEEEEDKRDTRKTTQALPVVRLKLVDFGLAREMPSAVLRRYRQQREERTTRGEEGSSSRRTGVAVDRGADLESGKSNGTEKEKEGEKEKEKENEKEREKELTNQVASRWYRAPEVLLGSCTYDPGVDCWAAGCIIAELIELSPLFPAASDIEQLFRILQVKGTPSKEDWPDMESLPDYGKLVLPSIPKPGSAAKGISPLAHALPNASPLALDLVERLLAYDPSKRISAKEALAHPWLLLTASMSSTSSPSTSSSEEEEGPGAAAASAEAARKEVVEWFHQTLQHKQRTATTMLMSFDPAAYLD